MERRFSSEVSARRITRSIQWSVTGCLIEIFESEEFGSRSMARVLEGRRWVDIKVYKRNATSS
jgi:hypothetical protein